MTFIAQDPNGGGRTVTNGSVHGSRQVFEIEIDATLPEMQQGEFGSGEVNRTGRFVDCKRTYHVIAINEALARALFHQNWGSVNEKYFGTQIITSVKPLFVIDGEISTGHK